MFSKIIALVFSACLHVKSLRHSRGTRSFPNVGLNDPHVHIFGDKAYVYATHDKSMENERFIMEDW